MAKEKKQNFIVQFPLLTDKWQEDVLDKRYEIGRKLYNSLINVTKKRYNEMIKTKKYRNIKQELYEMKANDAVDKKRQKELYAELNQMYKDFRFNEFAFLNDMTLLYKKYNKNIDSTTAHRIAGNAWRAFEKVIFGDGKKVSYKRYGELNSLGGKSNRAGIKIRDNNVIWNGLNIPIKINYKKQYEVEAISNEVVYSTIVRKYIGNKNRYYVQILFRGTSPVKLNKDGSFKRKYIEGDVGIDIGTQTIAISSKNSVKIYELADRVQNIEKQKRIILRKMDRSRRINNPQNYNEDGTIKKQGNKKVKWVKSKKYINLQNSLKELSRKQADVRKYQHECLANEIISLGNKIYVEKMNYKGLQSRAKETTINEKTGRINKKKRFGKSLANKAPAMLLEIINRKLGYVGNELIKINTYSVKASQYNHFDDNYVKKDLSERWNNFNGLKVQRDMYSAFLIMNVNEDYKSINRDKCFDTFDNFLELHNKEVARLSGNKNLSSIAI